MREHGRTSEGIPVVDLSSDEEEGLPDISWDEKFVRRLFSELNCGLLGPPGNDNIIILSDSNEEEEVREEVTADTEAAPPSTVNSPTPSTDASDVPKGAQDDNSDGGDKAGSP
jgi:hypothetical protein